MLFVVLSFATLIALASAGNAHAEDVSVLLAQADTNIGALFTQYFNFAFMLAGVLAFGAIVWGAFKYIIAAGNPSGQSDARDQVLQAIIGLLLLVGSGLILGTIDKGLLNIQLGELSRLEPPKPACATPCTGGQECVVLPGAAVGTCKTCTADCKGGVCMFNEGGSPYCQQCPSLMASECYAQGKVCKVMGKSFVCGVNACGDPGSTPSSPCPAGCTCFHDANNTSRPYACVKQNSTERCPTAVPPLQPPAPAPACTTCVWSVPPPNYDGCKDQPETAASGGCGSTPQSATNVCRPKYVKKCN